jgi:hypothetical protein
MPFSCGEKQIEVIWPTAAPALESSLPAGGISSPKHRILTNR